jgi:CheY-like chemotaxis protein/anti-sigma regulatory factor (Ser/Thr protein kinase)
MGDAARLRQVVWNLLKNAIKFTPPHGSIAISTRCTVGGGAVEICVRDSGIGIEPEMLDRIFNAFDQGDGRITRQFGGLGLGLAIVRQLVEMHGGTVTARSQGAGTGTTFEVRLPSVLPAEEPVAKEHGPSTGARAAVSSRLLTGINVLVVDDEEDTRELLQAVFDSYGAKVTAVGSAADAMREIDRATPDVIVSDIGMPIEDGFSLMRRIRARPARAGGNLPAIALTAYASASDRDAALAAGYQAHVAKPFEPTHVARLIHDLTQPALHSKAQ